MRDPLSKGSKRLHLSIARRSLPTAAKPHTLPPMPRPQTSNLAATVTLTGQHVHLVPLAMTYHDDLAAAVLDGDLWRLWYTSAPEPEKMADEIKPPAPSA